MRLNPDCVRDILFTVEDNTGFCNPMRYDANSEYEILKSYSSQEILYHIKQCELSGLLTKVSWFLNGDCLIYDLSPYGHEFLANIRSNTNWNKTKEISKKVGSTSLNVLSQIAANVISELIKK
ncbi:DUF2513 domain-containing protein [Clostridium baratii]|uniref:DUF2513 domain-containing protein n=1 Tax=Clostridium baratii TaxID=1561 RepID=UPI001C2179E8|nr:DUF2513 domain-containing protein [Clostridium baratii]